MIVLGSELMNAIIDIRYDEIAGLVRSALDAGSDPLDVLGELREGLRVVGERYQEGEYFLSQLFLAAETMKNALEILQPLLTSADRGESKGTIVIGSIEGDARAPSPRAGTWCKALRRGGPGTGSASSWGAPGSSPSMLWSARVK